MHVGGTFAEVARSEAEVAAGRHPERPFCLVAQPGVVDPTRAPDGQHTLWAYCHVPPGSTVDMADRIEAQIERFAPGFRDLILARSVRTAAQLEHHNPNYVGGDIGGGAETRPPADRPAHAAMEPVPHRAAGRLPVLGVDPAGRRGARHVRAWAARAALADLGLPARPGPDPA